MDVILSDGPLLGNGCRLAVVILTPTDDGPLGGDATGVVESGADGLKKRIGLVCLGSHITAPTNGPTFSGEAAGMVTTGR